MRVVVNHLMQARKSRHYFRVEGRSDGLALGTMDKDGLGIVNP